ncbi:MAG: hypothetical protein KIT25_17005 [Enhydrobacter sp.]|nr:MAG: hypothetical protein KIT25_17005 [Enhydrobacter sp.]
MSVTFLLQPWDSWFFRDSRPFDAADPGQMPVPSLFPPMPQTAIGAVRAAIARALGWDGRSDWKREAKIVDAVGTGDKLGKLAGSEVTLVRLVDKAIEPLFAAPHPLLGETASGERLWKGSAPANEESLGPTLARLAPGATARRTDLGPMRLPELDRKHRDFKPLAGKYWLTVAGIERFLRGEAPEVTRNSIVALKDVTASEARTGIARDSAAGSAATGMLYRVSYVRPQGGFAIAVTTPAVPAAVKTGLPKSIPFGGEGRMAWIEMRDPPRSKVSAPRNLARDAARGRLRYTVTLASPAELEAPWPQAGQNLAGLPGEICTACVDRGTSVSGWTGGGGEVGPRVSRATLPAGATWFLEAPAADGQKVLAAHGTAIGACREWGMGRVLIGTWS